jgi:hypothetical protein
LAAYRSKATLWRVTEKASNVLDDKQKHKLHEFIAEWVDEAYEDETEAGEAEE